MNKILLALTTLIVALVVLIFTVQAHAKPAPSGIGGECDVNASDSSHDCEQGLVCVPQNANSQGNGKCQLASAPTATPTPGDDDNNGGNDGKVRICHGTDSVTNPYTTPDVDIASATAEGHASHTGPVPADQAAAQALKDSHVQWGDIIPPFPQSGVVGGLNWTSDGQAIYNNDCNYAKAATPTPTITDPTATPTPGGSTDNGGNPGGPGDGLGCSTHSCAGGASNSNGPTQAVLGLSTTDSGANVYVEIAQLLAVLGLTATGYKFLQKNA